MDRTKHQTGSVRIGISGWNYKGWRGVFYPPGLPHRRELEYAASHFPTIEINGTFYSMQRPEYFQRWRAMTPDDFVFAVKGPRFITHMLKLKNADQALSNFMASGVLALGPKLGPILWQFGPRFAFNADRLESFLRMLPQTPEQGERLARAHHPRFAGRVCTEAAECGPIRHAVEIRHPSFLVPEFPGLLRAYGVALVCADTVQWPRLMDATTDFVYCRLHGSEQLYASGYEADAIETWAGRVVAWARGQQAEGDRILPFSAKEARSHRVYVYLDNDAKVRAPADALALTRRTEEMLRAA
jgi:uncharacterized protein YecE (DUF72 family)